MDESENILSDDNELKELNDTLDGKLNTPWVLWYHKNQSIWKINGFEILTKITTITEFWEMIEGIKKCNFAH